MSYKGKINHLQNLLKYYFFLNFNITYKNLISPKVALYDTPTADLVVTIR